MLRDTPSDPFVPDSRKDTVKAYTHWPPLRTASGFILLTTGLRSESADAHLRDGWAHTQSAYEHPVLAVSGVPSARTPLTAGPRPETGTDIFRTFRCFWLCLFDIFRCFSQRCSALGHSRCAKCESAIWDGCSRWTGGYIADRRSTGLRNSISYLFREISYLCRTVKGMVMSVRSWTGLSSGIRSQSTM